jgi:hypothetical protein
MNENDKKEIEADIEEQAGCIRAEREAEAMAAKNEFVAVWKQDSEGLGDLLAILRESAAGKAIVFTWMMEHPDINPPG